VNTILTLLVLAQAAAGAPPPGQPKAPAVQAAPAAAQATAQAQAPTPAAAQAPAQHRPEGGMWSTLIFFGVMILVFWLLIIRPQQKQKKKQEAFLSALKPGDKVLTSGGVIGRVINVSGDVVTLEVAKDVRMRVVKGHIAGNYIEGGDTGKKT